MKTFYLIRLPNDRLIIDDKPDMGYVLTSIKADNWLEAKALLKIDVLRTKAGI